MGLDKVTAEMLAADIKWIAELSALEDKVN